MLCHLAQNNLSHLVLQALSVNLRQQTLDNAGRNITRLNSAIERAKSTDAQRLKDEYQRLVRGLQTQGNLPSADPRPAGAGGEDWLANPALPEDIMREAVCCSADQAVGINSCCMWLLQHLPYLHGPALLSSREEL